MVIIRYIDHDNYLLSSLLRIHARGKLQHRCRMCSNLYLYRSEMCYNLILLTDINIIITIIDNLTVFLISNAHDNLMTTPLNRKDIIKTQNNISSHQARTNRCDR